MNKVRLQTAEQLNRAGVPVAESLDHAVQLGLASLAPESPATHYGQQLAPLPDHRYVNTAWWQALWHAHAALITPLRRRGLICDLEFGNTDYLVLARLPDDGVLIIGPQEDPPNLTPGRPEGWLVVREHPDQPALQDVIYDSRPGGPHQQHGPRPEPLLEAVDTRLTHLGLLGRHHRVPGQAPRTLPVPPAAGPPTDRPRR